MGVQSDGKQIASDSWSALGRGIRLCDHGRDGSICRGAGCRLVDRAYDTLIWRDITEALSQVSVAAGAVRIIAAFWVRSVRNQIGSEIINRCGNDTHMQQCTRSQG